MVSSDDARPSDPQLQRSEPVARASNADVVHKHLYRFSRPVSARHSALLASPPPSWSCAVCAWTERADALNDRGHSTWSQGYDSNPRVIHSVKIQTTVPVRETPAVCATHRPTTAMKRAATRMSCEGLVACEIVAAFSQRHQCGVQDGRTPKRGACDQGRSAQLCVAAKGSCRRSRSRAVLFHDDSTKHCTAADCSGFFFAALRAKYI